MSKNKSALWAEQVSRIAKYFRNYSIEDVVASLFISSLWLPNNGSTVKHQLLVAIFASITPNKFISKKKINDYLAFKTFIEGL